MSAVACRETLESERETDRQTERERERERERRAWRHGAICRASEGRCRANMESLSVTSHPPFIYYPSNIHPAVERTWHV